MNSHIEKIIDLFRAEALLRDIPAPDVERRGPVLLPGDADDPVPPLIVTVDCAVLPAGVTDAARRIRHRRQRRSPVQAVIRFTAEGRNEEREDQEREDDEGEDDEGEDDEGEDDGAADWLRLGEFHGGRQGGATNFWMIRRAGLTARRFENARVLVDGNPGNADQNLGNADQKPGKAVSPPAPDSR
ncbi:hypothetical protein ACQP2E_21815 [Actinoplanes sp. CA-015351]|uniref:hypothetical protein n=1 Tax=Actinoplanes sp. CA-015351 TaxID=3239897 RepID=UPI003D967B83